MSILELRSKRAALAAEALSVAATDGEKFNRLMAEVDAMAGTIERLERAEKLEVELRQSTRPPLEQVGGGENRGTGDATREKAHRAAFTKFLRTGSDGELRTYSAMSDSVEGAYIVPQSFQAELETALKSFGGVREVARTFRTATGNDLKWPTANDTTNVGELLSENSPVSQINPSFSNITLNAYTFSSKMVNLSNQLLQDSAFDLDGWLTKTLAERIARASNYYFTVGTGSSQPNGVSHAAVAGPTSAQTLLVGYDDLVSLEHSVDPSYRKGATFMLRDSVLAQIKKLKDSQGRPIWVPGLSQNAPDTILGYRYTINQDMPSVASGNNLMLFGDFSKFLIREVKDISVLRLNERYAENFQTAFIGFARYDSDILDAGTNPIKALVSL